MKVKKNFGLKIQRKIISNSTKSLFFGTFSPNCHYYDFVTHLYRAHFR